MRWVRHQLLCATKFKLQSALRRQAPKRGSIIRTRKSHATKDRRSQAARRSALPRAALEPIKMQPHRLRPHGHHNHDSGISLRFIHSYLVRNEEFPRALRRTAADDQLASRIKQPAQFDSRCLSAAIGQLRRTRLPIRLCLRLACVRAASRCIVCSECESSDCVGGRCVQQPP
eukprot:COSAG02_NODE_4229_length_5609_cov_169.384574_4_plen_173_part_00